MLEVEVSTWVGHWKVPALQLSKLDAGAEARLSFLNFFTLRKTLLLQNSVSVKSGISCRNEKIVMKIARVSSF